MGDLIAIDAVRCTTSITALLSTLNKVGHLPQETNYVRDVLLTAQRTIEALLHRVARCRAEYDAAVNHPQPSRSDATVPIPLISSSCATKPCAAALCVERVDRLVDQTVAHVGKLCSGGIHDVHLAVTSFHAAVAKMESNRIVGEDESPSGAYYLLRSDVSLLLKRIEEGHDGYYKSIHASCMELHRCAAEQRRFALAQLGLDVGPMGRVASEVVRHVNIPRYMEGGKMERHSRQNNTARNKEAVEEKGGVRPKKKK